MVSDKNQYGVRQIPPISQPIKIENKYWGNMKTLFEGSDYTIKRIFMREGTQSSLEYHVKKQESYYIERGTLKVGLRIGRAQNKSIILKEGDVFHIPVGLMHMRIALEDVIIIEASTKDDDTDSHIVEDGKTYTHQEEK